MLVNMTGAVTVTMVTAKMRIKMNMVSAADARSHWHVCCTNMFIRIKCRNG